MFKKLMASFGVGAAKVNLVLENEQCRIGESVTGKVIVEGGNVAQGVHTLDVDVVMKVNIRGKEINKVVDTVKVARDFRIEARETRELPFEHRIPNHYPISRGSVAYSLVTKTDIAQAVDTGDHDRLVVLPSRQMALVFDALQTLGFKEKIGSGKIERYGQEFEFYPPEHFSDQLRELELKFYSQGDDFKLFLELEMAGGYMRSGVEHHTELHVPVELLRSGSSRELANYIREFLENELSQVYIQGPRMSPSYHSHQHASHGSPFGGFMGGMLTGMLGGALLGELFDGDENEDAGGTEEMSGGGEEGDGGFDFGDEEF